MSGVAVSVAIALLCAAPAHGATVSVDDDRADCPAAAFTSVQAAVDAVEPGDTVAVCPGRYREGSGAVGTSALTIGKDLTLKGAGADVVRISPRRSTAAGGQIAVEPASLTDGAGDVVSVTGGAAVPITVHISGVTIAGDGVYVEAGVVYSDAQGSISRSRVTDVVTTEAAEGHATTAGAWRGPQPGYGIAHVTAATAVPAGAAPRTMLVDNVRIDRYNRAGVLFAGGGSFVEHRGVVTASEVVGRVLCQNFAADGDCSAPGLVTTGPLFGQDGVRVTGRAQAAVQGSIVTQNLVNGSGAPVRQTFAPDGTPQDPGTAGNANLVLGAGVRLVGADAASSSIARSNIVDNAYGAVNAAADGTTPSAVPLPAEGNWWGLRSTPPPVNGGPAISPAVNPPVPENPVNGAPVADGTGTTSTAVDFFPFRAGPQSDPQSGQFPNIQAPSPVGDAPPSVTLAAAPATAARGGTVTLTATAGDDFGVRRVRFADGATDVGAAARPPYAVTVTVPADAPCAPRTYTALAEDSRGQTGAASAVVTVDPAGCGPSADVVPGARPGPGAPAGAPPPAPTATLPATLSTIRSRGTLVRVPATAAAGVARVDVLLGARRVCADTAAPYACRVTPRAADVGLQTLRVVVTDRLGRSTVLARQVLVPRFAARGVRIAMSRRRSARRTRWTVSATVRPPAGMRRRAACPDGHLTLVVERDGRTFLNRQVGIAGDCRARLRFSARSARRVAHRIEARFPGNTVLLPARSTRRSS